MEEGHLCFMSSIRDSAKMCLLKIEKLLTIYWAVNFYCKVWLIYNSFIERKKHEFHLVLYNTAASTMVLSCLFLCWVAAAQQTQKIKIIHSQATIWLKPTATVITVIIYLFANSKVKV